ncbi:MAG: hypothetical protein HKL95_09480 [Phycisphaerae bacterium]|nr:hypothetical protein [Phycisphaerae bacterium]
MSCRFAASTHAIAGCVIAAILTGLAAATPAATTPITTAAQAGPNMVTAEHSKPMIRGDTAQNSIPSSAEIQRWIHDLASNSIRIRHSASKNLLDAGDAAMPAMKERLNGLTTPEMRHLLREDIGKINVRDFFRGPLITINATNISAQRAFEEICKQAGTTADISRYSDTMPQMQVNLPRVTIHFTKAPFWRVMQQMAVLTHISPVPWYSGQPGLPLSLNGTLSREDFINFEGAFAIVAEYIRYNRAVFLAQPNHPASKAFNMRMAILSNPGKFGPLHVEKAVLSTVVDSHGNSLIRPGQHVIFQSGGGTNQPMAVTDFSIMLRWPAKPGTCITLLKGYATVVVGYRKRTLNLKIRAKGIAHQTIGGLRFSVGKLRLFKGCWQFNFATKYPEGTMTPAEQRIVSQTGKFNGVIYSAVGTVLYSNKWSQAGNGQQGWTYTIRIERGGKPARITIPVYTRQKRLKLPFHFKDIPMP